MTNQIQELEGKATVTTGTGANTPVGKILVVDDELELKSVLVESLQRHGYEVTGCGSGRDALAELRARDFDLLLTDLMMPEMDGIGLLKAALEIDPHLIGIIVTGQGTIQTAVDAMQIGAFDYVLKPFRMQTLMPVLTRAMNVRHLRLENLQLRETVAIHSLCQTIAFTLDPQTVLSKLADAALQQSDADEVSILLPTSDGTELYVAAVRGEKRERLLGERIPLQQSISSWVARERKPLILNGEVHDARFVALWPRPEIRSAVSVPMQVANKLIGTINLNLTNRLRPFTLGQMKALTILASTAAAALESASLYSQVQQAEKNYRSIFENAVEGIFQATPEGRFLTVNPSMARILGYSSPEEMIETITDITLQLYVDPERRLEAGRIQEEQGVVQGFEFEAYRKDREKIWLSLNRRSIRNESGTEVYREGSVEDITERKRAEAERARLAAEIEKQRQRLNNIVATVPGVVWEAWGEPNAPTQQIDFVSNYVEQMLGYAVEEWLSTPDFWLSIVHPDDREQAALEVADSFASRDSSTLEFRWIAKDGHPVWVESNYVVIKSDDGCPVGLRGVTIDISERKRSEEALRQSESELAEAQRLAQIGSWNWDLRKNIMTWSDEHHRIFGVQRGDIDVNHDDVVFDFIHPEDRELVRSMMANTAETREPFSFYYRIVRRDGAERIIQSSGSVESDARGRPIRMFGTAQDVTEPRRIEQELRQSEERYRDLVENAHDIIYEHDLDGYYTSINKVGEEITGYSLEEILQLNLADTVAPAYLEKAQEMFRQKLAGETVTAYELEILSKDGSHVPVEVNTRLVFHDGVPVGVQGIARDSTERKRLEEALHESEEQLRQSQKLEAIGQLAGGVAHDFNNLLTAINGYSALALRRLGDDHPISSYLEEIKKAGDRAANLTRQLLAFGRKQLLQPLAINLNEIVSDMIKLLKRLIGEDVQLVTKTGANLKQIKADPGQLEQVLVNLVVNARDAMPRGGTVTIETANTQLDGAYASRHVGVNPGEYVMLAISDTGTGMDHDTRSRIFEPFFTTKEKGKGTGLGLSTVYGIVKQSGGNVWVYSEPGKGTTFKVYLPQVEDEVPLLDSKANAIMRRGSETVLLVEDEDMVRNLASQILEETGYRVLAANGGEEAIQLFNAHKEPIHLMITDVVMPKMSGRDVADRLKQTHPETKVLFMSGYTDEAIVHHGIVDSHIAFIQKPFSEVALSQKIREVLDADNLSRI